MDNWPVERREAVFSDAEDAHEHDITRDWLLEPLPDRCDADDRVHLEECPCCPSVLVYPVDWCEAPGARWHLELRCPNCEWRVRDFYDQDRVDRFDEVLNDATDHLIDALETATRENMTADVERFMAALNAGHIVPFDF